MTILDTDIANPEAISVFGFTLVSSEDSTSTDVCNPLIASFGNICFPVLGTQIITDWCERLQDRVLEQYKGKENLLDMICIFIQELQDLEFVYGDLVKFRTLDFATGAQLDGWGDLLNVPRNGLDDEMYRNAIKTFTALYQSNGNPEDVISAVKFLTDATSVQLINQYPARVSIFTDGFTIPDNLVTQVEQFVPAGVAVEITVNSGVSTEDTFTFAPDPGDLTDVGGKGFSEPTVPASGGVLTDKL